jgi:hypothetical protein
MSPGDLVPSGEGMRMMTPTATDYRDHALRRCEGAGLGLRTRGIRLQGGRPAHPLWPRNRNPSPGMSGSYLSKGVRYLLRK